MTALRAILAALAGAIAATAVQAEPLLIGHLSLTHDARYQSDWGYARVVLPPPILTEQAAEMALTDLAFVSDAAGTEPAIIHDEAADLSGLQAALASMIAAGAHWVVLDLPGDLVRGLADNFDPDAVTLVNATAPDDDLRRICSPGLLHSEPSDRMAMDAFAQYLRTMNWTKVLMLVGEGQDDARLADAFQASAERMRIRITDRRAFTLAANPGNRDANNIRLLTSGADYDVVFVADSRGEFGRYIPYATQLPRPVIGSVGLTATSWHWAFERDGATQVSSRFDRTYGRKMSDADWAVWISVKGIVTARAKGNAMDMAAQRTLMKSDDFRLDGSKGVTLSWRRWSGQLRMPILLATSDAVIAVAPIEGFLHDKTTLDTLGVDEREFSCE